MNGCSSSPKLCSYLLHVRSNDLAGEGLFSDGLQRDRGQTFQRISEERHVRLSIGFDERRGQAFLEHATEIVDGLERGPLTRKDLSPPSLTV